MLAIVFLVIIATGAQGHLGSHKFKHGPTNLGANFRLGKLTIGARPRVTEASMSSSGDYLESLSQSSSPRIRRYNKKVEDTGRERPSKSLGMRGFSSSKVQPKSSKTRRTAQSLRKNKLNKQLSENNNDVQVGRVSVYCLGASVDLSALRSHIFRRSFDSGSSESMSLAPVYNDDTFDKIEDDVLHISSGSSESLFQEFSEEHVGDGKSSDEVDWSSWGKRVMSTQDIFYFDYGCVVMWGLSPNEEAAALEELKEFVTEEYSDEELDESCDTLEFIFDHKVNPKRPVRFDRMLLRSLKIQERLALSYAMAQSSKLFVFESKVLNSLEETRDLPRELAQRGMISCSKRDLNMLIGQLFVEQTEVNLFSNILDTPDFLWEDDEHTPAYSYLRSYLEVDDRVDLLNSRLGVMRELLDVLTAQVENSNSSRLEWIIIFLIAVEIILGILSNPLFAGKRLVSSLTVPAAILAFKGVRIPSLRDRSEVTNL